MLFNTFYMGNHPLTGSLANNEDPDEMLHYVASHQGLHCLLRLTIFREKKFKFSWKLYTCDPSIYTMDHPVFIVLNQWEESFAYLYYIFCLFCCFTSQVNSSGHGRMVYTPNNTFSWAGLNKRLTSNLCTYFSL